MKDLNRVVLIGRLTKDVELRYSNSGVCFGHFSVAVNRSRKTESGYADEVNFFECDIVGKTAESLSTYLRKGKQIAIEGELVQQRWQQDGINRSKVTVFVHQVQLLGGTAAAESGNYGGGDTGYYTPQTAAATASGNYGGSAGYYNTPQTAAAAPVGQYQRAQSPQSDEFEDDIPF